MKNTKKIDVLTFMLAKKSEKSKKTQIYLVLSLNLRFS